MCKYSKVVPAHQLRYHVRLCVSTAKGVQEHVAMFIQSDDELAKNDLLRILCCIKRYVRAIYMREVSFFHLFIFCHFGIFPA